MKLTSPNSSSSEFCSGVAVRSSLCASCKGLLECVRDDVGRLVDIAQPVRFIDDDEIPGVFVDVRRLAAGELIGADDDGSFASKWAGSCPA